MKSRRYLKIIAIAFISTSLFHSCHDLDMHYEGGQMNDEQIQNVMEVNPGRISSSVNGMYAILGKPCAFFAGSNRADDFGYPAMAMGQDLNSGDVTNIESGYDWFSVALEWSDRTPTYANPQLRFGIPYRVIYAANDVLSSIADDTENAELIASRGQAKAMRAFSYLSLAPYFQYKYKGNEDKPSVPIIKDDMDPNCNPRATLRELYETTPAPHFVNCMKLSLPIWMMQLPILKDSAVQTRELLTNKLHTVCAQERIYIWKSGIKRLPTQNWLCRDTPRMK